MNSVSLLIKPVSGACEYHCDYCFYRDEMQHRNRQLNGKMTLDTLENTVRKAFAAVDSMVMFMFQGGEPMLAGIDYFKAFVQMARKWSNGKMYTCSLQTAGGRMNEEWASFLKQEGFLVGLSMDGFADTHDLYRKDKNGCGTHEATMKAARLLKQFEVPFNVLCVVTDSIAVQPEQTYAFLKQFEYLQFIPCLDHIERDGRGYAPSAESYGTFLTKVFDLYEADALGGSYVSVRNFDNYLRILSGRPAEECAMCGRCSVSFTVESDGTVYPCDFYCLDEWELGNINLAGLNALASCTAAKEFVNSSVYMDPECRKCRYYFLCRGGCRRDREPFGSEGHPALNRWCSAYKHFFEACYRRLLDLRKLISN